MNRSDPQLLRLSLTAMTSMDPRAASGARTDFPVSTLQWRGGDRELVLLDERVEHSPLTLDGTSLRGLHYRDGGLELHGGRTAPVLFGNALLPAALETAAGASYRFEGGGGSVTPNLYWFGGDARQGGRRGVVGSLAYGYDDGALRVRGEAGYGGEVGAVLQVSYEGPSNRIRLEARRQPRGIASLGLGPAHGTFADGAWRSALAPRLALEVTGSLADDELPSLRLRTERSAAEVRFGEATGWSVTTGVRAAADETSTPRSSLRSVTLPLGVAYEIPRAAGSALIRYQRSADGSAGGMGGRLSLRGASASLQGGAFVDYQRDAATAELAFREDPELARVVAELGLEVQTPDDVARVLHDDPALAELGVVDAVTFTRRPWKIQAGADLAWTPRDGAGQQLRARVSYGRTGAVGGADETFLASVSYSRRIVDHLEAMASLTWWTRSAVTSPALRDWVWIAGLRVRLGDAPSLPSTLRWGSGDGDARPSARVSGLVHDDAGVAIPGVALRLTDARRDVTATTDSSGWYEFAVAPGRYQLTVAADSLPAGHDATTIVPRFLELKRASSVHSYFAVVAHRSVSGKIRAADPGSVTVHLVELEREVHAGDGGDYTFRDVAPGRYTVEAELDGRIARRAVDVPEGPARVEGIDLAP